MTCAFWNSPKGCSKTESACLYAHRDTGIYAAQPRPVVPGGKSYFGGPHRSRLIME
jgi:hypothetical protein